MDKRKIGVFDSGMGGLTILNVIRRLLPREDYYYYADNLNNPYGSKSILELIVITDNIVKYLIDKDCKIIVVACNTATTKCIGYLRDKYKDIIFIGVEPCIKLAGDNNYRNILVLATPNTINSNKVNSLIHSYIPNKASIYLEGPSNLANAIERGDISLINDIIRGIYIKYQSINIDAIVLGCTHYPLVGNIIREYFRFIPLLDSAIYVSREVRRKLMNNNMLNTSGGSLVIYMSKNKKELIF